MQGTRDEFPERLEILEYRAVRIVVVRSGVVHVGRQPYGIADAGAFHEEQQIGDFAFAPLRRPIAQRNRIRADQSDRQVRGDHFPGRIRRQEFALQPGQLRGTQDEAVAAVVALVPGGIAVAAHIDQKHIEQRSISDLAIDTPLLRRRGADRHEFMKGAAGALDQSGVAILGITGVVDGADRRPVIGHLVVVPLRQHRHLRVEGAQIVVEQVVFVIATELLEAVRDHGFFLGYDVPPDAAIRQFQLRRHRTIGVDVIAGVDEEIRTVVEHGFVGPHAAARGIDAPALPRGIARPDKRYRASVRRRGPEMSDLRFA